jgi:SAM-dependent methyltransferase
MKTLLQIMNDEGLFLDERNKRGTDKLTKHPYSERYEPLFEPFRNKSVKLLEIGAYYGASTIAWDKYFTKGDITVVDIEARTALENIKGRVDENRTRILIGDAYTKEFADSLETFDIINDDGPHDLESLKKCVELYFPKLNPNGFLIIEDIADAEWFKIFKNMLPGVKTEEIDWSNRAAADSRVFIAWK